MLIFWGKNINNKLKLYLFPNLQKIWRDLEMITFKTKFKICIVFLMLMTFTVSALTRTVTESSDDVVSLIRNSNGNYWTPSFANLQLAINDIDNDTMGWVDGGNNSFTQTVSLNVGSGEFMNFELILGNNANVTMITNYDRTNGNDYIKIHDVTLEGNSLQQEEFLYGGYWSSCNHGIHLDRCDYTEIYNVLINNTHSLGILIEQSDYVNVHDSYITNSGWLYEQSGNSLEHYPGSGIYYYNTSHSTIDNIQVINPYACGIIIESFLNPGEKWWSGNCSVSNCIVTDSGVAYYFEDSDFITLTGCVSVNSTDTSCWGTVSAGVRCSPNTKNIMVSNLVVNGSYYGMMIAGTNHTFRGIVINDCSNDGIYDDSEDTLYFGIRIIDTASEGIYTQGYRNTIQSCELWRNTGVAISIHSSADHTRVFDNKVYNCGNTILLSSADYLHITGNKFVNPTYRCIELQGDLGGLVSNNWLEVTGNYAGVRLNSAENWTIINNYIDGYYGVREQGTSDHNTIMFNDIQGFFDATVIIGPNTRVNYTGLDEWNDYNGVS